MAGLIKLKGKYYARVYNYPFNKSGQKLIFLNTHLIKEAFPRKHEVEFVEHAIREGEKFSFRWLNAEGKTEVEVYTLEKAVKDYLENRRINKYRQSTLKRNKHTLNSFVNTIGKKKVVEGLGLEDVENFKESIEYSKKESKKKSMVLREPAGINIELRTVKTFLRWLNAREKIAKIPVVEFLPEGKQKPAYLSNSEFSKLMKALEKVSFKRPDDQSYFKKAFWFYRETGLRVSEPFLGKLDKQTLTIPPASIKSNREHDKFIKPELMETLEEMQSRYRNYRGNKTYFIQRHSKVFLKACRLANIEGKTQHSLRHTYATRLYFLTGDIYRVQKELGHAGIGSTMKYTNFTFTPLKTDFPDIAEAYFKRAELPQKQALNPQSYTDYPYTFQA